MQGNAIPFSSFDPKTTHDSMQNGTPHPAGWLVRWTSTGCPFQINFDSILFFFQMFFFQKNNHMLVCTRKRHNFFVLIPKPPMNPCRTELPTLRDGSCVGQGRGQGIKNLIFSGGPRWYKPTDSLLNQANDKTTTTQPKQTNTKTTPCFSGPPAD